MPASVRNFTPVFHARHIQVHVSVSYVLPALVQILLSVYDVLKTQR